MYPHLRTRSQASLQDLCEAFDDYVHDMMAHRALTTPDLHTYYSTASVPSMRSKEPMVEVMQRPLTPLDAEGGNVKVVVRVRKFVKRGMSGCIANDDHGC